MKRLAWIRPVAFVLLGCITLVALAVGVENVRGKRAFLAYQKTVKARGESLDWKELLPPAVPDDQNFAATPLLAHLRDCTRDPVTREIQFRQPEKQERLKALYSWRRDVRGSWRKGESADLAGAQRELRAATNSPDPRLRALQQRPLGSPAEDLLFLLAQNQAELDELRHAARRPHAVFHVNYSEAIDALLPEFAILKGCGTLFQTKALAELARNRPDAAVDDVLTTLAISDALRNEPLLIAGLVRLALLETAMQPLWEGLARRQWSEAHLAQLQDRLGNINLVEGMQRCMRGERAFSITTLALMKRNPEALLSPGADPGPLGGVLRFAPSGWVYQNQLAIGQAFDDLALPAYLPAEGRVDLEFCRTAEKELDRRFHKANPYTLFARLILPAVGKAALRAARSQATVDLATAACALERHRLAQGAYPETLTALVPRFLPTPPHDVATSQPLHYRREPDGGVLLYSVGPDSHDDGGTTLLTKSGNPDLDKSGTDWVWRLPAR